MLFPFSFSTVRSGCFFILHSSFFICCWDSGNSSPRMKTIYFDYNATTPLDPAVREAMLPYLGEIFGNPSSVHHVGRRARALLDAGGERVAKVGSGKPSEIVFTRGGTESNNLALSGVARHLREPKR